MSILPSVIERKLGQLRFPTLFVITTLVFLGDLAVPDVLPFVDEILLALATLMMGSLRRKKDADGDTAIRSK
jgi:hypothetical protein